MELYMVISITDRINSADMLNICNELSLPMTFTSLGKGTAKNEHLSLHNLSSSPKAVLSAIAGHDDMKRMIRLAKERLYIDIPGNGVIMAVPLKSVSGKKTLEYLSNGIESNGGAPKMEFEHELIIVILNEGYSDTVMEAAVAAGAGGGTVLHAKGTGRTKAEKFFGVSLAEEKDLIYIISPSKKKSAIMNSITKNAGMSTKAGAICFSLPISEVAGLRKLDEE